jgi:CHAD domain-containing protein
MLIAAEPVAGEGADPEGVHDMRVGTRRLRAALSLYGPALPPAARALRAELRWLANALGEVRDLDVQLERMERLTAEDGRAASAEVWAPLALVLARRRDEARARELLPALDGERYRALLSELHALVEGSAGETPAAAERAATALRPALERRGRRLERALARAGPRASAERRHLARIEAKRARYAIECCAALYGRPARRAITALRRLQELLGAERDASTAADALHAIATGADGSALPSPTLYAMGELAERERVRAQELVARLPPARARAEARWRRLRRRVRARSERPR